MQRPRIDDRYEPGDLLGGGGMAEVYLAHDQVLGRDVALKILRGQYANEEGFVERFRREAKNAAALNHPNVVQVYDQGSTGDGTYYIAMEYVPGVTLAERLKREGPLEPGEAAGEAARVAEALAVAHERGIIHRDIKPQNVLLTASGGAKVADFGIARAASAETVTETSLILGTASYMSPEQVRGERVSPASDLYSLGVVLYEMLTGEPPYTADNPLATAMKHLEEPPRHPREVDPAVPESLDAMTAKLLAKDPKDRYASAAELAEDLRRVRDGLRPLAAGLVEGTSARMPRDTAQTRVAPLASGSGATGSRPRRRNLLPLVAVLVGVILLGGLAWALSSELSNRDVSGGAARVEVPDLSGLSRDEARARLEEAGLRLGSQDEAASAGVNLGTVIEQVPSAGSEAERGSAVDVVMGTGPAAEPTTQSSPSPSPSASPSAPSTSSASASPQADATAPAQNPEAAQERAHEAADRAKELRARANEREKELKEAQKDRKKGKD